MATAGTGHHANTSSWSRRTVHSYGDVETAQTNGLRPGEMPPSETRPGERLWPVPGTVPQGAPHPRTDGQTYPQGPLGRSEGSQGTQKSNLNLGTPRQDGLCPHRHSGGGSWNCCGFSSLLSTWLTFHSHCLLFSPRPPLRWFGGPPTSQMRTLCPTAGPAGQARSQRFHSGMGSSSPTPATSQ